MRPIRVLPLALLFALPALATAQPTAQERLWEASIAGDTTAIVQALADGADVDSLDTRRSRNGRRALNWAALNDHASAIRILVAHGATIEARNRTGFTPIHHAAEAGAMNAARALLDAGADPTATNAEGNRPVDTARSNGHIGVALLLANAASTAR